MVFQACTASSYERLPSGVVLKTILGLGLTFGTEFWDGGGFCWGKGFFIMTGVVELATLEGVRADVG